MTASVERTDPELKHIFDRDRIAHIATQTAAVCPSFDATAFRAACEEGLDALSLMQRLDRVVEALHTQLPADFAAACDVLRALAPRLEHRFVMLLLPQYVGKYGLLDFDVAMRALHDFTPFGSSEFAVRPYLRQDLERTLRVMGGWAPSADEHVRRLASEGCRPRLPWSFRLEALVANPRPTLAILELLKADPSLYVRKSVANHFNDITKDHAALVLDLFERWSLDDPRTRWIVRHALRTLIKKGDARALALVGAQHQPQLQLQDMAVFPPRVQLGDSVTLSFALRSTAAVPQRLVVDYAIHYVKQSGAVAAKVFKLKTMTLEAGASVVLVRRQAIRDMSTRRHHAGRHMVEIMVNGEIRGQGFFDLVW